VIGAALKSATSNRSNEEVMMVKIIARISAKTEAESLLRKILSDLVVASRKETGCISYELLQDDENPVDFITLELWADDSVAAAHLVTPHVAEAFSKAGDLLAQPPIIHRFTQLL
jgi:quinol monooxygenase YgiN